MQDCVGKLVFDFIFIQKLLDSLLEQRNFQNLIHARTLIRVQAQELIHQALQFVGIDWRQGLVGSLLNLLLQQLLVVVVDCERRLFATHFIKNHAQTPNVGLVVVGLSVHYFRGEVKVSAGETLQEVIGVGEEGRNAEVPQLHDVHRGDEDVRALDVSVDDLPVVHVFQG